MNYYNNDPFTLQPAIPAIMDRTTVFAMEQPQTYNSFEYPGNLPYALVLIQQAVASEEENRTFYTYLIENAPTNDDGQMITGIRNNEISHINMFYKIYNDITGNNMPPLTVKQFVPPFTYCEGIKRAILAEQDDLQNYRKILYAMQTPVHINMLTEIITDEIRHGLLYNYLYSKNECKV